MRYVIAAIFAVLATAAAFSTPYWGENADFTQFAAGPELTMSEQFVQDVRTRHFADATALVAPQYRPKDMAIFETLLAEFPKRKEDAIQVTAWHKMVISGAESTQIELFYLFGGDGVVRGQFIVDKDPRGTMLLRKVNLTRFSDVEVHANDFRLPATALDIRWIYLGVGVLFDLFAFATFVLCLASPVVRWRWRWLWALFVLAGALRVNLDWSTLEFNTQMVSFLAPPAGFYLFVVHGGWVLALSVPLGALLYWARRFQWRQDAGEAAADIRR